MNIHFVSLGCDKNLVDSEVMLGILHDEGYQVHAAPEDAEVIVINTCGFIMDAADEGIQTILQMAAYKAEGKCKALVVTGCMAQRYRKEIFAELPEVDAVVGVADIEAIGQVIREVSSGHRNVSIVTEEHKSIKDNRFLRRVLSAPGHYAYLKIAEGCDNCCAYCTIPAIRGGYRSRSLESIINETKALAQQGVKEIILVAQDTSLYGADLYGELRLPALLRAIAEVDGICWIRVLYCYPEHITDELVEEMSRNQKVCHYIDMPVQHGSNRILQRMGRLSTVEKIQETIEKLRRKIPGISIRTTVMTGFPGESQADFDMLLRFVKEIKFDKLGAFAYSREEGTAAYAMPDQVNDRIKAERRDMIMKEQQGISAAINESLVGKTFTAIVDGFDPGKRMYCARSHRDCYDIDGLIFFESEAELMAGDFVTVEIVKSSDYDMQGRLVPREVFP